MTPVISYTLAILLATTSSAAVVYKVQKSRAVEAYHLRASIDQMKRSAYEKYLAQSSATHTDSATTNAVVSAVRHVSSDYRFEGQSTPVHALQSFAWACDQGDLALMKSLIVFADAARPKAQAFHAHLPVEMRAKAPDVESWAALLLVEDGMQRPFPRADLLARATVEEVGPDLARTRLPGTPRDGGLYQKVGSDWKYVITEEAVDRYLANASKR